MVLTTQLSVLIVASTDAITVQTPDKKQYEWVCTSRCDSPIASGKHMERTLQGHFEILQWVLDTNSGIRQLVMQKAARVRL